EFASQAWLSLCKMALQAQTETLLAQPSEAPSPSLSNWEVVSEQPASGASASVDGSPVSSEADDLVAHFTQMKLPDAKRWARKFRTAGYCDMDELGEADLAAVFEELQVPSGIRTKMARGMSEFKAGNFATAFPMPAGDLDATAPVKANEINWGRLAVGAGLVVAAGAAVGITAALRVAMAQGTTIAATGIFVAGDCLDGDALIIMSDRSQKKIKNMRAGDQILAFNAGKMKVKQVLKVETGKSSSMRALTLRRATGGEFIIKATAGHPFYTKANGWAVLDPVAGHFDKSKPVAKLAVGEELVLHRGNLAKVVDIGPLLQRQDTFNLHVDGPGTFFAEGILSHSGLPPLTKK
ncbi:unnamed protein product, partial [Effrenium voratum]